MTRVRRRERGRFAPIPAAWLFAAACATASPPPPVESPPDPPVLALVTPATPPSPSATPAVALPEPADPLPSWNEGESKQAILAFVARVIQPNGSDFVPVSERLATFGADGTLWPKQPKDAPTSGRRCAECIYQPMLEVLDLLRTKGFQIFVVSRHGIELTRAVAEQLYGISREHVVGGGPVEIQQHIGRRPIAVFGNFDSDQSLLAWTASGSGARLVVLVDDTDGERERTKGFTIVNMKDDWKTVFPAPPPAPPPPPAGKPPAPTPIGSERGRDFGVRLVSGE